MSRSRIVTITTAAGFALACSGVPIIDPPPPPAKPSLFQIDDGTCMLDVPANCPPPEEGMTCNPPPPLEEPCPPLESVRQISRQPDGTCQVVGAFDCPEAWNCSSEATFTEACPPQLGEADRIENHYIYGCTLVTGDVRTPTSNCPESMTRPMPADYRIDDNGDGTCTAWFTGDISCPEDASCNPPPPQDVACPPEKSRPIPTNPPAPG